MANGYSAIFGPIVIDASNEGVTIVRGATVYDCDDPGGTYATIEELLVQVESTINGIVPGNDISVSLIASNDDYGCHVVFSSTEEFTVQSGSMLELLGFSDQTTTGLLEYTGAYAPIRSVVTPGVGLDTYGFNSNRARSTTQGDGKTITSRYSQDRRRSISWSSLKQPQYENLFDIYKDGVTNNLPVYYLDDYEPLVTVDASKRMDRMVIDYKTSGMMSIQQKQYANSCLSDIKLEFIRQ